MRRVLAIGVAGVVALLLQTAVFPVLLPVHLAPNLLLVLVVYLGVHQYGAWGVPGAFALGYCLDTFSGTVLGLHALAFTVVYLGVLHVARVLWTEGGLPAVVITFAAACAYAMLVLGVSSLVSPAGAGLWSHGLRIGLVGAAVTAAVTPLVFAAVAWQQRLLGAGS